MRAALGARVHFSVQAVQVRVDRLRLRRPPESGTNFYRLSANARGRVPGN